MPDLVMTISKQAGILADYAAYLAGKNERTVEAYLRALRQFLAWLAEQPGHGPDFQPAHLSRTALEIYLAELRKGDYSLSHQARVKSAVSGFARWLIEEKSLLQRNPTRGIKLPPEPLRAPRQLNDDQRFVLQQLVEKANDVRGAAIFALGYWAGCRVSDVSHLKMANTYVNRKIGWLRVGYKGEKLREIDLVNAARRPLNDYLQSQGRQNSASITFDR
jgi:site-specific recombinase XerC